VKTLPARQANPIRGARDLIVLPGRPGVPAGRLPVLEVNAVRGRHQRVGESRIRAQRLPNHHTGLRPRIRGRHTIDARPDLAIAGHAEVDEPKFILRAPDVRARGAHRIDAVRDTRRAGGCDLSGVDRSRRHSRKESMGNETRMVSRNDFMAISPIGCRHRRSDGAIERARTPCFPASLTARVVGSTAAAYAATFFFERHAAALHSRTRLVGTSTRENRLRRETRERSGCRRHATPLSAQASKICR